MPTKDKPQIKQWSFSRLKDWRGCPAKAKYKHIDRLKEPSSPVLQRGTDIHKMAEEFSLKKLAKIPVELSRFKKEFGELRKSTIMAEERWGLTREWEPTGFFDDNVWLRLVVDCAYVAKNNVMRIIDYKTGKMYEDNKEQLSLYAIGGFAHAENIDTVSSELWYLDSGDIVEQQFPLTKLDDLKAYWEKEAAPMLNDTRFAPTPSRACTWCHFSKFKNGPCKY